MAQEEDGAKQEDYEIEAGLQEDRSQGADRQDFQGEDDAFDVVRVGSNEQRGVQYGIAKDVEGGNPGKKNEGEFLPAAGDEGVPFGLEYDGKDEGVDDEHDQGGDEGPDQAEVGAAIKFEYLPSAKLPD